MGDTSPIDEALGLPPMDTLPSREERDKASKHVTRLRSRFLCAKGKGPVGCVLLATLDENPSWNMEDTPYDSFVEQEFHEHDLGNRLVTEWGKDRWESGWLANEPPGVYEVLVVFRVTEPHQAGSAGWIEGEVEVLEVEHEPHHKET